MITTHYSGNLIPFFVEVEHDTGYERRWGYMDEGTKEVVIEAQYVEASPFVGDFAAVINNWEDARSIINKDGTVIPVGRFGNVYFLTSENGKSTVAVLENKHSRKKLYLGDGSGGFSGRVSFYTVDYYKYRMVNLATGKTIIPEKEGYRLSGIETVGDYFLVEFDLYQFLDNGDIECVAKDDPELAVRILKDYFERLGINAQVKAGSTLIDIDYRPYISERYADPDLSGALRDLSPEFDIRFERSHPFYRDHTALLNAPLAITERLYLLRFRNDRTSRRAMGIYNETKSEWVIPPYFTDTDTGRSYYITDIFQTNNEHLYRVSFTNDELGWQKKFQVFGGIYNIVEKEFMENLYLYRHYSYLERLTRMVDRKFSHRFPEPEYFHLYYTIKQMEDDDL